MERSEKFVHLASHNDLLGMVGFLMKLKMSLSDFCGRESD